LTSFFFPHTFRESPSCMAAKTRRVCVGVNPPVSTSPCRGSSWSFYAIPPRALPFHHGTSFFVSSPTSLIEIFAPLAFLSRSVKARLSSQLSDVLRKCLVFPQTRTNRGPKSDPQNVLLPFPQLALTFVLAVAHRKNPSMVK